MINCDNFFGIALFVFSTTMVVYTIVGYYYVFSSLIHLVSAEFKSSKFIDILEKLIRIREDEETTFEVQWVLYFTLLSNILLCFVLFCFVFLFHFAFFGCVFLLHFYLAFFTIFFPLLATLPGLDSMVYGSAS